MKKEYKIFVIADTHFGHKNIIKYCDRPFKDVEEMDKALIDNWNSCVNDGDIVYVLGDFSFYSKSKTKEILDKLKGCKVLIKGNHDRGRTNTWWKNVGFIDVYSKPLELWVGETTYILTHEPIEYKDVKELCGHVLHGHLHNNKSTDLMLQAEYHTCVSVECTEYKPVEIGRFYI